MEYPMSRSSHSSRPREGERALSIDFHWPGDIPSRASDNYFLGLWHPHRPIQVDWSSPTTAPHITRHGLNWFLASAKSPLHPADTGLVHGDPTSSCAVGFRGYVFPHLHSYSHDKDLFHYWQQHLLDQHNGIFSAAVIGDSGRTLTLLTDALGIGTLYYRTWGEAVLFSTNPRYLSTGDDRPDFIAWRSFLQTSWIMGDRSLSEDIRRVPAGGAVHASQEGMRVVQWFAFSHLPDGTESIGPDAVDAVEETFHQAMRRCLTIQSGKAVLPLSSGFDSRRILTGLLKAEVDFQAITCRVFQKEYRDLDATFAGAIAYDLGFPHRIVQFESLDQYVMDDEARRMLVDGETHEHTWALRVMAALPEEPSLVFDGIGGDVLGCPVGWSVHIGLSLANQSVDEVSDIAQHGITHIFDSVLHKTHWPDTEALREELKGYLRPFCPRPNISELAFLLLRQRRGIALWSQQLLPPGHIAMYPYFDLDYLRLLLGFRSADKLTANFQRACLRKFWPDLYKYPGNRDIPADLPPGSPRIYEERARRCYRAMSETVKARGEMWLLQRLLTMKGRLTLRYSQWDSLMSNRGMWYLSRLMELVWRHSTYKPCWHIRDRSE